MSSSSSSDEDFVRPYLRRGSRPVDPAAMPADVGEASMVRSYTLTGGRTRASVELPFEAMLTVTEFGRHAMERLTFERRSITTLCSHETLSVAEVAAMLSLPIGVIRVLAADLIGESFLEVFTSSENVADDISLILKLIEGVRAL